MQTLAVVLVAFGWYCLFSELENPIVVAAGGVVSFLFGLSGYDELRVTAYAILAAMAIFGWYCFLSNVVALLLIAAGVCLCWFSPRLDTSVSVQWYPARTTKRTTQLGRYGWRTDAKTRDLQSKKPVPPQHAPKPAQTNQMLNYYTTPQQSYQPPHTQSSMATQSDSESGYPSCTKTSTVRAKRIDFCSEFEQHRVLARQTNTIFLVKLEKSSKRYKQIGQKFRRKWCTKKGSCPKMSSVFAIINPQVEAAFLAYRQTLPSKCSGVKMYFHGTSLCCFWLEELNTLCNINHCGICGISKNGFRYNKIRRDRFQRFGPAFYLAPNSSKANDYCSNQQNVAYKAMLLCEVASGKKHTAQYNMTYLDNPPKGCHAVYGKSSDDGALNYDEIVIFKAEAICPRYIVVYRMQ